MALIHDNSKPSIRGQIDLFSIPSTDTTVDYSVYSAYQPLVNVGDAGSKIEFKIPANADQYIDLNDSFLYVKVQVVNKDKSDLADAADISTSNLFLHSLFSQVDVYFNSVLVSTSNNVYPYKAYMETLLSYGNDYKSSQGTCSLFYPDTGTGTAVDANTGYKARKDLIAKSRQLEMIDKIRFDLAAQTRYILNDVNINISLTRSTEAFSLLTGGTERGYTVKFLSAMFYVRRQVLYPSINLAHQKLLESGQNARYPYKQTKVKYFTIARGNSSTVEENLFSSSVPSRVVIGFCSSAAFNGDMSKNPFQFSNYGVNI